MEIHDGHDSIIQSLSGTGANMNEATTHVRDLLFTFTFILHHVA